MKKLYVLLLPMFSLLAMNVVAQPGNSNCGTCTVDLTCPTTMPDGGLCPEMIPDGQVGEPYDFSVTFFMPEMITVTDPIPTDVTLVDVEITDLINLPNGLEWTCSTPNCNYQPSSNPPDSELGCIRICGTPNAAPGTYTVNIRLLADVFVSALNVTLPDQEQFYTATITILPPNVPIDYNLLVGCGSINDTLTAEQDFNPDQPTEWSWDLGDGTTADGKQVIYEHDSPGTYDIVLETTVYDYVVTELCISSISDGYCGDVEEAFCNCGTPIVGLCPDPYVSILGTSLPEASGTDNHCWNNLSIPTGGLNFVFTAFDADTGPPTGSEDDLLGEFDIMINNGAGVYSFSNGNMSGSVTIGTALNSVTTDTLMVTVFENPPMPMLEQTFNDLSVTNNNGYDIQWYLNGAAIPGASNMVYPATEAGDYTVIFTDANGCTMTSDILVVLLSGVKEVLTDAVVAPLTPNPADEKINFSIEYISGHDLELTAWDALGRKVYGQSYPQQSGVENYTLDVSDWGTGLYFIQVQLEDGSRQVMKLTVE